MGVAVDASGNVYITEGFQHVVMEWNVATQSLITLVSLGLSVADGVAVDGSGSLLADSGNEAVKEWPRAFVSTAAFSEARRQAATCSSAGPADNRVVSWNLCSHERPELAG